jgi:putative ABC transport system permease protein
MQTTRRAAFYRRVLGDVRHLPGVSQAAYISFLPMTMRGGIWPVVPEGATSNEQEGPTASLRFVTPGFFDTMRIPLRQGRDISEADDDKAPHVAVVSESFVRRHWPGVDPIGRRFFFAFETRTVVGVVGDVKVRGLERTSEPQVYLSYQQVPDGWLAFFTPKDLAVRSRLTPDVLVPQVRRIIGAADPEQPISDVQPLSDVVTADTASRSVQARVLAAFAVMAFLLAGLGVHGLLTFTVSARTRELSVRIALGARPRDIVISVVKRAALLTGAGVAAGVAVGLGTGRTLQALLAGVTPADPQTIGAVVMACGVVTLLGSVLPAMRAGRTNPIEAMKAE